MKQHQAHRKQVFSCKLRLMRKKILLLVIIIKPRKNEYSK
jgi:hypothetical protein